MAVASRATVDHIVQEQRLQLTPRQQELLGWFGRNAPSLREAYEAAIRLLSARDFPARVPLISHLVRDIGNRLPDVIEGTTSERVQYENMLDEIAPLWQKHFQPRPSYSSTSAPSADVSDGLPWQLLKKIDKLDSAHRESRSRLRPEQRLFRSELLGEAESPDLLQPMEKQFRKIRDWFMGKTHLQNTVGEGVSESELVQKFELFERAVLAVKGQFFKAIGELDEILQDTND